MSTKTYQSIMRMRKFIPLSLLIFRVPCFHWKLCVRDNGRFQGKFFIPQETVIWFRFNAFFVTLSHRLELFNLLQVTRLYFQPLGVGFAWWVFFPVFAWVEQTVDGIFLGYEGVRQVILKDSNIGERFGASTDALL